MLKLPAKTVPAIDGGTLPLRTSKNPVLGVYLHHCGSVASVHQPKGKRKDTFYLICDECGTDQCGGKPYQEKIKNNMQPNIEALQKTCDIPGELPVKIHEEKTADFVPDDAEVLGQIKAIGLECGLEVDSKTGEPLKPIETAKNAVSSEKQVEPVTEKQAEKTEPVNEPVKPAQTASGAAQTETVNHDKAKRVGIAALIGAGFGLLLAI
ncbi:hypothetical protein QL989_16190 [Pseudoalteromonas sp. APC 3224]|uniref:hypothetical protein n=1 Tax=Pseudoalteromonas sp. APC 3224 TaxID=3035203 RepID=UPI0025B562E7|nr:hypothetical protein [Pseudoalteromonas sp. APC 3224]MDN3486879.1 hypothetical protein [Pseudoalteromonas sp. APC 3224]